VLSIATAAAGRPAASSASPATGPAAGGSRAVVVIDDGVQRTATCVQFAGASVSGLDALRATGASVDVAAFGSKGGAVCSIQGIGCPVSGCLTCQAPAYWNYFRASPGAGSFTRSGLGASSTTVYDGDVEAWVWGAGVAGGQVPTVDSVCGVRPAPPAPAPVPAPAPAPASPAAPGGGGANGAPADPGGGGGADAGVRTTTTTSTPGDADARESTAADADSTETPRTCRLAGSPATTDAEVDECDDEDDVQAVAGERAAGEDLSAAPVSSTGDGGGTPWVTIVAFVVLLGAVATWAVVMRHRRSSP
jgi:hypothetical protein